MCVCKMRIRFVLLCCVLSAVQGLSTAVTSSEAASPAPWQVNVRYVHGSRTMLQVSEGSLIASNWVLAWNLTPNPVSMWIRFGALNLNFPKLIIETSDYRASSDFLSRGLILIALHRHVETTPYIAPVSLVGGRVPDTATVCWYDDLINISLPGEEMTCSSVQVSIVGHPDYFWYLSVAADDNRYFSTSGYGTPLVNEGVQIAMQCSPTSQPLFLMIAPFFGWIEEMTGLELTSAAHHQSASEHLKPVHAI